MYHITKVVLTDRSLLRYLKKRGLIKQFHTAKIKLLSGYTGKLDFKIRQPKKDGIYSFRINKQFRALGYIENHTFIVIDIYNHQ